MAALPSDELVLVHWLRSLPAVPTGAVSTTLPADSTTWAASGFVQVIAVGGESGIYVPMFSPVIAVHTWAAGTNSDRPPWPVASKLIEQIVWSTYQLRAGVSVDLPAGYEDAWLHTAYPIGRPRRVPGDPSGYAHMVVDLQITWHAEVNIA